MVDLGDRHHNTADWIAQYLHHSLAPLTDVPQEVLRNAYVYCQQQGRLCMSQSFGYDVQDPIGDATAVQRTFVASSKSEWVGVARCYRTIPEHFNTMSAHVQFSVYDFASTQVDHRLRVIDASTNEDNATATLVISAVQDSLATVQDGVIITSQNHMGELMAAYPFTSGFRTHEHSVTVSFSNVSTTTPGKCQIILEARANGLVATTGTYDNPLPYRPLYVQATCSIVY